jgi:hypothetical protein
VDQHASRHGGRRFRKPQPGDEVQLHLRDDLSHELAPVGAGARVRDLRAHGVEQLRVRVLKVPRGSVLAAEDAVKVEAPELTGDRHDPGVYVRIEFLDLPAL